MNFNLIPTLEHIALVHITATLWNAHDIRLLLNEFLSSPLFLAKYYQPSQKKEKWKAIENRVKEKVPQLMIPTTLKKKMLSFIEPIGMQILKWMEYHLKHYSLDLDLPNEFYWTSQGTVDKKKTAAVLIKDESINITTRYELACIYCLEHDIRKLWDKIPESHRTFFYDEEPSKIQKDELIIFWTYFIKGKVAKIDKMFYEIYNRRCSYKFLCKCAAGDGNKEATKYFLQKLPSRKQRLVKRAKSVVKNHERRCNSNYNFDIPREYYTDVLYFLISQMTEAQQIEVFQNQPYDVLKYFSDWPWENFFLETTRRLWILLPNILNCDFLVRLIIEKLLIGFTYCECREFFGKLWQQIPDNNKSTFINDSGIADLIFWLLDIEDEENIKLIFQAASVIERRDFIFSERGRLICKDMICKDAWDLLKFFIQLCNLSKEEMVTLKQEFQHNALIYFSNEESSKLDVFYKLLDDFISRFGKKEYSSGEGNIPAKRLCRDLSIYP